MQSFYESGRILFAPSVWYESGSRALAESTLSGRPVITTDCGGNKEMIGNSGTVIRLPDFFHEKPYNKLLPEKNVAQLTDAILKYFDDEEYYREKSKAARTYGAKVHDSMVSAKALSDHFKKLILEKNKKI